MIGQLRPNLLFLSREFNAIVKNCRPIIERDTDVRTHIADKLNLNVKIKYKVMKCIIFCFLKLSFCFLYCHLVLFQIRISSA